MYLFLERVKEEEREGVKMTVLEVHQSNASCTPPSEDMARKTAVCPDWGSNLHSFSL